MSGEATLPAPVRTEIDRLRYLVRASRELALLKRDALVRRARAAGNTRIITIHRATDHSWSDSRIALASAVITWLERLQR